MPNPLETICEALRRDEAATVRRLLAANPELKALVNEPVGPFDAPAINFVRSKEMLDVLLEAGADINARSRWWAGGFGLLDTCPPELAAYALERGAILTVHAAARLGLFDELHAMTEKDPSLVHARGGDGQTPLHFASSPAIAEFLLAKGAHIDARDVDHESTPAQYMVRERSDVARFLVSRGCETDLLLACALGDFPLVERLLAGNPDLIRMAVNERFFPKVNPRSGGAIYNWTLGSNKTAHLVAKEFGHEDIYRFLIERSPLELQLAVACAIGDEEQCGKLLVKDPNLARKLTEEDQARLPHAAREMNLEAVRLMLGAGWPVDALGQHRGTALHWAAFHGLPEMVQLLLRHRASLEVLDADFQATPLGWAIHGSKHGWNRDKGDYPKVIELLRSPDKP